MAGSYKWSGRSYSGLPLFSTGSTMSFESPEEERERKKREIKSIIGDDKYLLQELLTELRKEKLNQLKNVSKH